MKTTAKVIADSISPEGKRLTTLELQYPRIVHAELLTHRVFSRNASSSRAIPVLTVLAHIFKNMFVPSYWGATQKGMQAKKELPYIRRKLAIGLWRIGVLINLFGSYLLYLLGVHKQLANRNTEYGSYIKVLVTATDFNNWFNLRTHSDAQPEIRVLACKMQLALQISNPKKLNYGEWHTPYMDKYLFDIEKTKKISASCCAQVSYRKIDKSSAIALKIFNKLIHSKPRHSSPFEHVATPMVGKHGNFNGWFQYRQEIENANR